MCVLMCKYIFCRALFAFSDCFASAHDQQKSGSSLGWLDLFGVAVWLFGFYFEAVGDFQLAQFIKNPSNKGKLMQSGLGHILAIRIILAR